MRERVWERCGELGWKAVVVVPVPVVVILSKQ
jgi:hypothetical protein